MKRSFTAIIERDGDGYTALCPELDIASQGDSVEQARDNLREALELFFETASSKEVSQRLKSEKDAMRLLRPLLYLWAFPGSLVGLLLTPLALMSGGRARVVGGVLEVHGGWITKLLQRGNRWMKGPIAAITLGHVVLGCDEPTLERTRRHERVHVRQYERWGPFFIPAYLLASGWLMLRGDNAYLDNPFEVEAYAVDDPSGQRS